MEDARNQCLRKALELLPPCNHLIMWRLMLLLNQIHRNSDVNKMSARNLGRKAKTNRTNQKNKQSNKNKNKTKQNKTLKIIN